MPFANLFAPVRVPSFPPRPEVRWEAAGVEPSVEDLLSDPITHLVMQRDRVTAADVLHAINEARRHLNTDASCAPAPPVLGHAALRIENTRPTLYM